MLGSPAVRAWVPPTAAFVVARAVVFAASLHTGLGWPGAADLSRADSFNYLSIAAHGYVLHPCPPACVSGVDLPWSGNSGWFPLFSILVAPFSHVGVGPTAGAVMAAVFEFASFALLWFGFLREIPRSRSLSLLALACVFPGAIYYAAVFPISLFVALVIVGLIFIRRRQLPAVTAVAFLVASAHPTGWVFAATAAWAFRSKLRWAMLPLAAAAAAVALIFAAQWEMTGHWNAYLLSEKGRGDNGTNNPLHALSFAKAATLSYLHDPSRYDLVQYVQTMLVLVLVLVALAAFVVTRVGSNRAFDGSPAVAVFVGLAWLAPLVIGGASLYRTDATLLPALILVRRVPPFATVALCVAAAPIAYLLDVRFFQGLLA
jgi:hypothetical protein